MNKHELFATLQFGFLLEGVHYGEFRLKVAKTGLLWEVNRLTNQPLVQVAAKACQIATVQHTGKHLFWQ